MNVNNPAFYVACHTFYVGNPTNYVAHPACAARLSSGSPGRNRRPGCGILKFQSMIFSREYIGYLARRTVKHLVDAKMIHTDQTALVEARVTEGMIEELSLEDRINDEVRVILEAYQQEMLKSGAQYAEMFKKVKGELARKYKAVL
jgi:hypothetical protein